MALVRKLRKIGNSLAFPVPDEIFEFLNFDPSIVKYKLMQENTGEVFLIILDRDEYALDEKNFQKNNSLYCFIIPKPLRNIWNIGNEEGQVTHLQISYTYSDRKWLIKPV